MHLLVQKEQSRHPDQHSVDSELTADKKSKIKRFTITYMEKVVAKFNAKKNQHGEDARKRKSSDGSSSSTKHNVNEKRTRFDF